MNAPLRTAVPAVSPRPATTTLIVRDGPPGLEVLMVRRSMQASFMPGAYVFPGGAVDPADGSTEAQARCDESPQALAARLGSATGVGDLAAAFAVAGLRECFEECGLWLGAAAPDAADWAALRARLHGGENLPSLAAKAGLTLHTSALQPWAHWVTPVGLPKRFDTLFLLARAPLGQVASVDTHETTTLAWVHPPAALADQAQGSFQMEFATVSVMRSLQPHAGASAQALLDHAAGAAPIATVQPRLSLDAQGHIRGVLLPGQPGFDTAAGG
jgi:8-oxo-dGTP pyrophosphatase MutT (NUDIX family)